MKKEVIHFKSQDERLTYLRGGFEEIIPQKAETVAESAEIAEKPQKTEKKSPKPKAKAKSAKSTKKKGAKKNEVQAE